MKNQKVKDHFLHPVHMGIIEKPTHQIIIKSETCSDVIKMMLIVDENEIVSDIKTQVYGCGYVISGTSIFNEIAIGKKVSEINKFANDLISTLLIDIPETNKNCIQLPVKAFNKIFNSSGKI